LKVVALVGFNDEKQLMNAVLLQILIPKIPGFGHQNAGISEIPYSKSCENSTDESTTRFSSRLEWPEQSVYLCLPDNVNRKLHCANNNNRRRTESCCSIVRYIAAEN